jgi:hypothetical protein
MTIEQHYEQLNGFKLTNFKYIGEGDEQRPSFTIRKGQEIYTLVICQDPEDNGPGFLHIDEWDGK